jgi:hypothetical protein
LDERVGVRVSLEAAGLRRPLLLMAYSFMVAVIVQALTSRCVRRRGHRIGDGRVAAWLRCF